MSLDSYSNLITEVQSWLFGRDDIVAKVPTFVRMFEAKANRVLRCRQMETRATVTLDIGTGEPEFVSLPTDYHSMRRIRNKTAPGKTMLSFVTSAQLDMFRQQSSAAGSPEFFTVFGDEIELYPTPDQNYQLEMVYRKVITPLDNVDNTTNWLLALAPDLYLYGSLMEAAPYLHEDERVPVWASGVSGGFDQLNKLSEEATYNAGPLVIRRRRGGYS